MQSVDVTTKIMLNRQEAAAVLGLEPQTLAVWACKGIGPAFCRVGRSVRYRRDDLDAFLQQSRITTRDQQ